MAFGSTFKICKKIYFDQNQLKLSTQHQYMYVHVYVLENVIKIENSHIAILMKFG